jgi:hypothetical protein
MWGKPSQRPATSRTHVKMTYLHVLMASKQVGVHQEIKFLESRLQWYLLRVWGSSRSFCCWLRGRITSARDSMPDLSSAMPPLYNLRNIIHRVVPSVSSKRKHNQLTTESFSYFRLRRASIGLTKRATNSNRCQTLQHILGMRNVRR